MKIYLYNGYGFYIGVGTADKSPREPGKWLIPGNATSIAPPQTSSTERVKFINGAWLVEPIPQTPAPVPDSQPPINSSNWVQFRRSLQLSDEFLAIANAPGNAVLAGLLFQHIQGLQIDPTYGEDVALVWGRMIDNASPVDEAHVMAIAQALENHHIPIELDLTTGKILLS